jgi:hypothetical protein
MKSAKRDVQTVSIQEAVQELTSQLEKAYSNYDPRFFLHQAQSREASHPAYLYLMIAKL